MDYVLINNPPDPGTVYVFNLLGRFPDFNPEESDLPDSILSSQEDMNLHSGHFEIMLLPFCSPL